MKIKTDHSMGKLLHLQIEYDLNFATTAEVLYTG